MKRVVQEKSPKESSPTLEILKSHWASKQQFCMNIGTSLLLLHTMYNIIIAWKIIQHSIGKTSYSISRSNEDSNDQYIGSMICRSITLYTNYSIDHLYEKTQKERAIVEHLRQVSGMGNAANIYNSRIS